MILNTFKTVMLLAFMSGILLALGSLFGGDQGLKIALVLSLIMNFITYFFSEKIVLSMYREQPLDATQYSHKSSRTP